MTNRQTQRAKADLLKSLHIKGDPVIIYNIWDAGSAKVLQECGAKVIATGSWSVAAAHGYEDREKLPLELALANVERIVASVSLPVSMDFEGAYGVSPSDVQANVARVIETGAVGINFEDQIIGRDGLYPIQDQCARIRAIRSAAEVAQIPFFINARTDIFLKIKPADHSDDHLKEALQRASAYAEAGASGFFAPGLRNARYIEKLCEVSPLPVNILMLPDTPSPKELAKLGVARISYGPLPYRQLMESLKAAAKQALT